MYNPGEEYLSYIKDSIIRKPRSKIVVDGKTYTGLEHLVSFPKITHETEKMIGGFPAKTCEFEIYNLDGSLNLNGKEVQVYRGLDISNAKTVWVPMGLFYADGEDVTNNSTKRTIQFKGTDRTRLFDAPFEKVYSNGIIPTETVVSTVVEKICLKHGLSVDTATKANIISYRFTEAVGTPESTTDRQMISWIAELSGCIPIISRDGQSLVFTRPTYKETVTESGKTYPSGAYADKSKYKTLSAEPLYGSINAVSFGHADYDDAYVYQDDADVQANGLHEWQINDNPLVENDRTGIAPKVFAKIKGMKLYPFNLTDFIDDYLFDINDGIQIKKKDGTYITSYVLGMRTTSRIRSTFKAGTQNSSTADRNLAGSVKADLKSVKLSVDHVNNQITALVKESDDKYSEFTQTINGIKGEIVDTKNDLKAEITATASAATSQYTALKTEVKENYVANSTYNTFVNQTAEKFSTQAESIKNIQNAGYITKERCNSLIEAQSDKITLSVEQNIKIGTRNILLNSECFAGFAPTKYKVKTASMVPSISDTYVPSGRYSAVVFTPEPTGGSTSRGIRFVESDILGQSTVDKVKPNTTYTLSFWLKTRGAAQVDELEKYSVIYAGEGASVSLDLNRSVTPTPTTSWQKYVLTFTITGTISKFYIMLFFKNCLASTQDSDIQYWIDISSFKLEEGNIATDWTPSAEDTEKSVQAKIDMCVKMDENGNLESEINISSDKLTIDTQNFTLAKDGTMTCENANLTNATISGTITAVNAILGGWHIADNELYSTCGSCTAHIKAPQSSSEYFFAVRESLGDNKYTSNFAINTDGSVYMNNLLAAELGITVKTFNSKSNEYVENLTFHGLTRNNKYFDAITAVHDLTIDASNIHLYPDGGVYLHNYVYLSSYASGKAGKAALYVDTKTGEITVEN
nr:MAG TPA: carbohydrate binding domain protein [Caudoviricetes sp.]